ncbi:MAG: septum formation initiator family protein [Candidatus Neomarinimicrobiota bacterium]|jgi:cell division protein FtsB|nr:septum formation initiator family protein [Candidatus Neomarinimicrobiota bacterium]|tara:strand:+ start:984 stop:1319 length:336 start_codon:yes stop_codon:yes gene_type:complete
MRRGQKRKGSLNSRANIQKKVIKLMLLLGLLVLLITFFFGDHGLYHLYTLKSERKRIQAEIDYLRNQRITLEDEKTRLKTDYKYIEEMAREKYRMAKKREKVFKVIEKKED